MVRKLFKHECIYYVRTLLPMELIFLGLAILNRLIQLFETNQTGYRILFTSSVIMLTVAGVVCAVMTVAVAVVRFYRNLYSNEGYLSFTLPVTYEQHILVKLLAAILFTVITLIVGILGVSIATLGSVGVELWKAGAFLLGKAYDVIGAHIFLYAFELLLFLLLTTATGLLLLYACVTVGQMAKKNRILASFGAYFVYYIFTQIVGTVLVIVGTVVLPNLPWEKISDWIGKHIYLTTHTACWIGIVFAAALGLVYYLITRAVMHKKLNLE